MKDAVSGRLYITLKEDGETVCFGGSTVIPKDPNSEPLYYTTGNQEVCSAQFELKPINPDEFNFINKIWEKDLEFDAVFSHKDGSINYVYPCIEKQPMYDNLSEDDGSFVVSLSLLFGSFDIKLRKNTTEK